MSTAEILSLVSLISYIAAGVLLVLAVFFWFFFKIPSVMGNLSGRTAKKSIEQLRQANVRSGSKSYRSSTTNAARGKLTDPMPQTQEPDPVDTGSSETTPLAPDQVAPYYSEETTPLANQQAAPPYSAETTPLYTEDAATTMLDSQATATLGVAAPTASRPGRKQLTMLNEVMMIHTDEVI